MKSHQPSTWSHPGRASLDAATAKALSAWLQAHAGTDKREQAASPQERITRSAWFVRENHKLDPAVWTPTSVRSEQVNDRHSVDDDD